MGDLSGKIEAIALKTDHRAPMREVTEANVFEDRIEGSAWATSVRGVTVLFVEQWEEVMRELGASLPWHARRANILVSGLLPSDVMKKRLRLGALELQIHGETRPCERMDEAHMGFQAALKPDMRGGVYESVARPGRIVVGDTVSIVDQSKERPE
jgi:MOSC domain-containing protein YiiM